MSRSGRVAALEDDHARRLGYRTYDDALERWAECVDHPELMRACVEEYDRIRANRRPTMTAQERQALKRGVPSSVWLDAIESEEAWRR